MRSDKQRVVVWDALTRVFHWGLVAAVAISFYTTKTDGVPFLFPIEIHAQAGYLIIGLLVFRILWGMVGGVYVRFSAFLYSPKQTAAYTKALISRHPRFYASHNPLGGWMVIVMLLSLAFQAISGLFLSDDIFFQGPLNTLIDRDLSRQLSRLHALNSDFLVLLIGLHLTALVVHRVLGERLMIAMVTGVKYFQRPPIDIRPYQAEKRTFQALGVLLVALGVTGWLWFY